VIQENENFKSTIRAELDDLRTLLTRSGSSSTPDATAPALPSSSSSPSTSVVPPLGPDPPVCLPVTSSFPTSPPDFQNQMLMLLTESFSKLSTAMPDRKEDSKMEWPKFLGDPKKFCAWHMSILTQLSLPPWKELYDPIRKEIVLSTTNTLLNEKLYAKLRLALDGSAFHNIVNRKHLRANGLLLLQDLVSTYRPKNIPEVIAAKTSIFWGSTKRSNTETVDDYYNRFCELFYEINGDMECIPVKDAIRHFIFTLGSDFETIQNNFRIENLPLKWQTEDWPTVLTLCRDYHNSVRPQGILQPSSSTSGYFDHTAHRKKVKSWFMNPGKFCKEIEAEQAKHPNKCLFHLSKTHTTDKCTVKAECDALISSQKSSSGQPGGTTGSTGKLHHTTDETFEDAVTDDVVDSLDMHADNDTNEEELIYFATNHYLRSVKASETSLSHHDI
jgi:hypothetical protein